MSTLKRKGAEEARKQLPALLDDAEKGHSTIITRHGRPIAVLVSIEEYERTRPQQSILPLQGSGRGLWGEDPARTIDALRDEWER